MARNTKRTYDQYCPVALALDAIGERWTLLVVRNLMTGPKRYTDLRVGLPGIATDLLSERLRALVQAGLVRRRRLAPPAASEVYELTELGEGLEPVVLALGRFGIKMLDLDQHPGTVTFEQVVTMVRLLARDEIRPDLELRVLLDVDGRMATISVSGGGLEVEPGGAEDVDLAVRGDALTIMRVSTRALRLEDALKMPGISIDGTHDAREAFKELFQLMDHAPQPVAAGG